LDSFAVTAAVRRGLDVKGRGRCGGKAAGLTGRLREQFRSAIIMAAKPTTTRASTQVFSLRPRRRDERFRLGFAIVRFLSCLMVSIYYFQVAEVG